MDAMTILSRCREAAHDIERLAQLIAQRRGVLDGLSGPQMDPNGGGRGSQDPDKVGRIVADIDELERKKQRREEEQEVEKVAVTAMIFDIYSISRLKCFILDSNFFLFKVSFSKKHLQFEFSLIIAP